MNTRSKKSAKTGDSETCVKSNYHKRKQKADLNETGKFNIVYINVFNYAKHINYHKLIIIDIS